MVGGAFGSVVGKVGLGFENGAGDGGDVYDGAGEAFDVLCCRFQEGKEGGSHEIELWDVGAIGCLPILEGSGFIVEEILLEFFACLAVGSLLGGGDAGVVDQYAETFLARGDLLDEICDIGLGGDVGDEWDDFAGDVLAMLFDDGLELLFSAAYDVDFRSVDREGLRRHEANSGSYMRKWVVTSIAFESHVKYLHR